MFNIIPRPASKIERLFGALNQGLSGLTEGGTALKGALNERQTREALKQEFGDTFGKIRNPELQRLMVQEELRKREKSSKDQFDIEQQARDYETIKKYGGEEAAEMYRTASIGGKTAIMKSLLDSLERGESIGDLFSGLSPSTEKEPHPEISEVLPKESQEKLNLPDYTVRPKGFSKKEWGDLRKGWTEKNEKTLDTSRDRLKSNKRDILGTKKLINLNESHELPEDLDRFLINPNTGEIYGLAQLSQKAPTAAQEWVKEIARFGNRAKDAYGSRVTNFDLSQYMKQFPSLLNTYEGRKRILRMMEINYELDSLYEKAAQRILDQKGSGNIPPAEVDRIARGLIKDDEERLFNEYLENESQNEMEFLKEKSTQKRPSLEEIFR